MGKYNESESVAEAPSVIDRLEPGGYGSKRYGLSSILWEIPWKAFWARQSHAENCEVREAMPQGYSGVLPPSNGYQ